MKKYRPLLIAAIILAVLALGYWLVVTLVPPPEEAAPSEPLPTYLLTDYDTSDVDNILFEHANGYSYYIDIAKSKNEQGYDTTNYLIRGKTQYEYDRSALGMTMMYVTRITVNTITDAAPKDLAAYGLSSPQARMTITPTDGASTTLLLGNRAPVGSSYYAMVEGKPEVYLIGDYIAGYILNTDYNYRTLAITAYTEVATEIASVDIVRGGESILRVVRRTDEEMAKLTAYDARYLVTAPVERNGNDTMITENLLTPMATISALSVVEDAPADLSIYGLGDGATTTVIAIGNTDGTSRKITLGEPVDGVTYGTVSGINSVFTFNASNFSFVNIDYKTLLSRLLWLHNIQEITKVDITLDGAKHVLEIFDPTDEEKEAGKVFAATLDGEELSEQNGRRLYTRILSPTFYDFVDESMTAGRVTYSFTITMDDGTQRTLAFAPLNSRQLQAIADGEPTDFYINISDMDVIAKAIAKIQKGETLPMVD